MRTQSVTHFLQTWLTPQYRLMIAALVTLVTIGLFMSYGVKASWEFTIMFRGKKLLTFLIVAFCIACSTLFFQTLSHNRIITPAIMGFDSLYILIQTLLVFSIGSLQYAQMNEYVKWGLEVFVLVFASSFLFQWLFIKKQLNLYILILIGVVLGVFFQSISGVFMRMISPTDFAVLQDSAFASFGAVDFHLLMISALVVLFILIFIVRNHHKLDVLALDKFTAINLGVDQAQLTRLLIIVISVLVGLSTSLVGPVTFFGLLVVNLAYFLTGSHLHRFLIPMTVFIAMITLISGEFVLQHVLHYNTRLSIIIEFVGGLFFLSLVIRKKIA